PDQPARALAPARGRRDPDRAGTQRAAEGRADAAVQRRVRHPQRQERHQDLAGARTARPSHPRHARRHAMTTNDAAAVAAFDPLTADADQGAADLNLDVILDVPVSLSLEVGRARIPIRNLLQLNQGSVVELERGAGEPLDVYVNGTLIAQGEVVVVNDRFGVRLTDVVSPAERIKRLR